jgi:hypothetical protein
MTKPGRKRKTGVKREPSGRIAKASRERQEAANVVVLAQPHRRGSPSHWRCTAWGRVIEDSGQVPADVSRAALFEAGSRYLIDYRRMLAVTENVFPYANAEGGTPPEIDRDERDKIIAAYAGAMRSLRDGGIRVREAIEFLVIEPFDEMWQPPHWVQFYGIIGLTCLAEHYGLQWRGADRVKG